MAGNLVPFRSPDWDDMHDKQAALAFGSRVWRDILARVKPEVVIAIGNDARGAVRALLNINKVEHVPLSWGSVAGERGRFSGGVFVGLPHLSRYAVFGRPESERALTRLLGPRTSGSRLP